MKRGLEIYSSLDSSFAVLDEKNIMAAEQAGITAIKEELPEEVLTVEDVKNVISEI